MNVRSDRGSVIAVMALVVVYAALSVQYSRIWRDELSVWTRAAVMAPLKPRAQINYALALLEHGRFSEASEVLDYAESLASLPLLTDRERDDTEEAVQHNRLAIDMLTRERPARMGLP